MIKTTQRSDVRDAKFGRALLPILGPTLVPIGHGGFIFFGMK